MSALTDVMIGTGYGEHVAQLALANPSHVALYIDDGIQTRSVTIQELDSTANQLARYYLERGVAAHRIVTIPLPNSFELIVAMLAAWKIGAIPNPVSSHMPPDELTGIISWWRASHDPLLTVWKRKGTLPRCGSSRLKQLCPRDSGRMSGAYRR